MVVPWLFLLFSWCSLYTSCVPCCTLSLVCVYNISSLLIKKRLITMSLVSKTGKVAMSDRSLIMLMHESCVMCSQIIAFLLYERIHAVR